MGARQPRYLVESLTRPRLNVLGFKLGEQKRQERGAKKIKPRPCATVLLPEFSTKYGKRKGRGKTVPRKVEQWLKKKNKS